MMKYQRFEDYDYSGDWAAVRNNMKNLNLRDIYEELGSVRLAEVIEGLTEQEMMFWLREYAGYSEEQIESIPEMTDIIRQEVMEQGREEKSQ